MDCCRLHCLSALLFAYMLVAPIQLYAQSDVDTLQQQAESVALASDPVWLELLAYERQSFGSAHTGQITSTGFYLHADGKINPELEMQATLAAFLDESVFGEDPAHCRYPGRFLWLDQHLALQKYGMSLSACKAYGEWRDRENVMSISLLFVTGYLGNPASYYGHNMLKLNSMAGTSSDLQDASISFGASIPDGAGFVDYLFNGVFGGYGGVFNDNDFFHYANNYGETELRDIWEYELKLEQAELDLLLAHLWELMQGEYVYYFFDKNCAYRIGRLFEVLHGLDLTSGNGLWYTPQTLVQRMYETERREDSIVQRVAYHPSRQSRLYQRYQSLSIEEKQLVREAVDNIGSLSTLEAEAVPIVTRQRVLDVLIDYYQYLEASADEDDQSYAEPYRQVLAIRYSLPAGLAGFSSVDNGGPHQSRKIGYATLDAIHNSVRGGLGRLKFRPAYYDNLDFGKHQAVGSALSMGELDLVVGDDKVTIRELTLFKVESNVARSTGLPGDDSKSWLLKAGFVQDNTADSNAVVLQVTGGLGRSHTLLSGQAITGWRLGGGIQESYRQSGPLFVSGTIFATAVLHPRVGLHLEASYRDFLASGHRDRILGNLAIRFEVAKNLEVRLFHDRDIARETGLRLGYYW